MDAAEPGSGSEREMEHPALQRTARLLFLNKKCVFPLLLKMNVA